MNGTEKQITWANEIKSAFIANIRKFDVNETGEAFIASLTDNAAAWIDARLLIGGIEFASELGQNGAADELFVYWSKKAVHGKKILALVNA